MAALRFERVSKHYGKQAVLRDINLEISEGRTTGLVGLNGAGKSTLLASLLDFCAIDRGRIEIFGLDHRLPRARARLAFLPEQFMPPYYLTGHDLIALLGRLHGQRPGPGEIESLCRRLDFDPAHLSRPARAYSKGMRQKLGLIACLACQRELLVLDEPMSGLDPRARALTRQLLREHRENGGSLFFSSHGLNDLAELCDEMVILHQGRVKFHDTLSALGADQSEASLEQAYLEYIK